MNQKKQRLSVLAVVKNPPRLLILVKLLYTKKLHFHPFPSNLMNVVFEAFINTFFTCALWK